MAPQLRIRQQTKGDPSGDGYKMAETSNPEKRSSVNPEDNEDDEDQPLVCKLCSKCFTSPRRLNNHKDKCPVARRLKIEDENFEPEFPELVDVNITYIDKTDPLQFQCTFCPKIYFRRNLLRQHQVRCFGNKKVIQKGKSKMKFKALTKVQRAKFRCTKCNKKFKFENSFIEHCTQEHSELPNSLPCAQCPARCPSKSALDQHQQKVHKPASFKCPNCNAMFTRNYHVLRHMEQRGCNGGPTAIYQCKVCVSRFTRKDNLLHHLRNSHMSHNKKFQCRQCLYGVDNYNKFIKHYMTLHMDSKKYVCDHCGKRVSSRVSMAMHLKSHDSKKYVCSTCNYQARTYNIMSRHMYTHSNNKPFKCDLCSKSFVQRSQLRTHVIKHSGYTCETCSKKFLSQQKLAMHMNNDHGANINIVKEEVQDTKALTVSAESKYECELCHKTFSLPTSLQKHMLTHTLDKPRRCMYCARGRAYVRSDRLIKHLRDKHPDVFRQHVDVVRNQCGGERDEYINYKVTPDEIDRILEILDEFQDRMLKHGKVLYGGLVEAPQPDDDSLKKADSPLMLEDELIDSLRKLLMQLIDASTLEELGWPEEDVDVVLEKVIEQCGQRPADRDRWSRVQRLRENAKHLFLNVIEDSGIKRMLEMKTIDQVIRHILKVNELVD